MRSPNRRRPRSRSTSTRARADRHRRPPRLGAQRRRSLLQPRQERLLRRRAVLPRDPGFMVQFGIHGNPAVQTAWRARADQGRSGQAEQQARLRRRSPRRPQHAHHAALHQFRRQRRPRQAGLRAVRRGRRKGMDVVDKIYDGYGEGAPRGKGPDQGRLQTEGNAYLTKEFPEARLHQDRDDRASNAPCRRPIHGTGWHVPALSLFFPGRRAAVPCCVMARASLHSAFLPSCTLALVHRCIHAY